jgi:hypothetical protein
MPTLIIADDPRDAFLHGCSTRQSDSVGGVQDLAFQFSRSSR